MTISTAAICLQAGAAAPNGTVGDAETVKVTQGDDTPDGDLEKCKMPSNLEAFISGDCLPEVIDIYDNFKLRDKLHRFSNVAMKQFFAQHFVRFVREYPPPPLANKGTKSKPSVVSDCPTIGQLDLRYFENLGYGSHSEVGIAPLTLPSTAAAPSIRGAVAVKLAYRERSERDMLLHEAKIYNAFPRELQEGGLHVPPIVPKFYGYYVPSLEEFDSYCDKDKLSDADRDFIRCFIMGLTPILLLEPCGRSIRAQELPEAERETILALLACLHAAEFAQGSFYERNILVQPGPLTVPRAERSLNTPSYRIIDFGRGVSLCVNCNDMDYFEDKAEEDRKGGQLIMHSSRY